MLGRGIRLPAPSGQDPGLEALSRAACGRAEGDAPASTFTCSLANGAGGYGKERRAGARAHAETRRGGQVAAACGTAAPREAHQGHGWDAERDVPQPSSATRASLWDFLSRCDTGGQGAVTPHIKPADGCLRLVMLKRLNVGRSRIGAND